MKILFVHPLVGNAYELFKAFTRNPDVNIEPLFRNTEVQTNLLYKIRFKLRLHGDIYQINKLLLTADLSKYDVIFVVKGNEIRSKTLQIVKQRYPHIKLVNWSLDDMYAWHNRSIFYTLGLKYYDQVFTTKSFNLQELPTIGAKNVYFIYQAYSQDIHKSCIKSIENLQYDVVFIGFPEKERFESLEFLARHGIRIDIFGYASEWKKQPYATHHENLIVHAKGVYGLEYAQTLSSAKISLCFLRKANRDLHTSRSIEIPACGGFMLAERTVEHSELFTEDKESVYFSSDEELLEKVRYYLEHDDERKKIAEAGLKRCQTSGYSYDDMVEKILKNLDA